MTRRWGCWASSSTRGTWIEIRTLAVRQLRLFRRPPHGGRGLKLFKYARKLYEAGSSSTRGTWIEIRAVYRTLRIVQSSSTRGTWIEMYRRVPRQCACTSSSTRGTWIEIAPIQFISAGAQRRPPHGGRGLKFPPRNRSDIPAWSSSTRGTWIEIGALVEVVYNPLSRPPHGGRGLKFRACAVSLLSLLSSSTRGTWIEISHRQPLSARPPVVLHTGDVD